ncbi:hypothetical protein [Ferrimonas aestuarii]|uniref:Uncharacterized protein n=1 Tax=Ferrimonas aestuarii TaxID=2569539 RepID=A0A4U1BN16_9GAMM|nr:hypothetical protein [Ferrimonas aestuarii]TKB54781.1 hypothetical protein FCL42_11580 [Ferrimonas aestuarii]
MITLSFLAPTLAAVALHNPLAQPEMPQINLTEVQQQIEMQLEDQMLNMQRQAQQMDVYEPIIVAKEGKDTKTARAE